MSDTIENLVLVVDHTDKKDVARIWCDVCEYVLVSSQDIRSQRDNGCCEECWLTFGQSRREDWKNGWRPIKETLERYKRERSIININLKDIIGE